jgi:hypothetical protein
VGIQGSLERRRQENRLRNRQLHHDTRGGAEPIFGLTLGSLAMIVRVIVAERTIINFVNGRGEIGVDTTGDGIPNRYAIITDTNGDGVPNEIMHDSNGDRILDQVLSSCCLCPSRLYVFSCPFACSISSSLTLSPGGVRVGACFDHGDRRAGRGATGFS